MQNFKRNADKNMNLIDEPTEGCGDVSTDDKFRICAAGQTTVVDWNLYDPEFSLVSKFKRPEEDQWIATRRDIEPFEDQIHDLVPKIEGILLEKHNRIKFSRIAFNGGAVDVCIQAETCFSAGEFHIFDYDDPFFYFSAQSPAVDMLLVRAVKKNQAL